MSRPYLVVLCLVPLLCPLPANAQSWQAHLKDELSLMGHRNWILIVDSAYPEQVGPGIETVETNADQLDVVRTVLTTMKSFIPDQTAPGISAYRAQLASIFHDYKVQSRLHQSLIDEVAKDGALYHVLVLKTQLAVPYTSVFIHLDCKYWSADNERDLRAAMSSRGSQ